MEEDMDCSICGNQIEATSYGNNTDPVNDGLCCDDCNMAVVMPARLTVGPRKTVAVGRRQEDRWWLVKLVDKAV